MLGFSGIGAQKAGTTWLYNALSAHPAIYFPGQRKERHYWNRQFPSVPAQEYLQSFQRTDAIGGDITPAYGHLPPDTIRAIHQHCPELRLIYLLRNPVERAWSSALMALQRAELQYPEASPQWFIDHFQSSGSLQRGDYERAIKNWLAVYPEQQLLILFYEQIADNPAQLIQQCCRHIGAPPFPDETLNTLGLEKRVFAGPGHPLPAGLRRELLRLYQPKIHSLSHYLNKDLSHWLHPS